MRTLSALLLLSAALNVLSLASMSNQRGRDDVLRVRRLEVVNENGDLCAVISGDNSAGGEFKLLQPSMVVDEGKQPIFAYIGNPFKTLTYFSLYDPQGTQARVGMTIDGNGPKALISGHSTHGNFEVVSGRIRSDDTVISIKDSAGKVIFDK